MPLCAGIVDDLEAAGIKAFGPTKWAARLEGSKGFTKDLCKANNIPTAAYERFKRCERGKRLCSQERCANRGQGGWPCRGQRRGGGRERARSRSRHRHDVRRRPGVRPLGRSWSRIVWSAKRHRSSRCATARPQSPLASAQDHKRVGDGDNGPNTGGMGAYSPAPIMTDEMNRRVMDEIIHPDRARDQRRWARPTRACCSPA